MDGSAPGVPTPMDGSAPGVPPPMDGSAPDEQRSAFTEHARKVDRVQCMGRWAKLGLLDERHLSQASRELNEHLGLRRGEWRLVVLTGWLVPDQFQRAIARVNQCSNFVSSRIMTIFAAGRTAVSARCDRIWRWLACLSTEYFTAVAGKVQAALYQLETDNLPASARLNSRGRFFSTSTGVDPPEDKEVQEELATLRTLFEGEAGWQEDKSKQRGWERGWLDVCGALERVALVAPELAGEEGAALAEGLRNHAAAYISKQTGVDSQAAQQMMDDAVASATKRRRVSKTVQRAKKPVYTTKFFVVAEGEKLSNAHKQCVNRAHTRRS